MTAVTLSLVPWAPGTAVGAYPRRSEQMLPEQPPTMVAAKETKAVAADASLTYTTLADGEYWAAAPLGSVWRYVAFLAETPSPYIPGPEGPAGAQGPTGPQGPVGATGPQGPAGPATVSADAGNQAKIGTDGKVYVADIVTYKDLAP